MRSGDDLDQAKEQESRDHEVDWNSKVSGFEKEHFEARRKQEGILRQEGPTVMDFAVIEGPPLEAEDEDELARNKSAAAYTPELPKNQTLIVEGRRYQVTINKEVQDFTLVIRAKGGGPDQDRQQDGMHTLISLIKLGLAPWS